MSGTVKIAQYVGTRIRTLRQVRGLKQSDLAERADMNEKYISQIECGKKNVTVTTLDKLLKVLDVSYAEFFEVIPQEDAVPSIPYLCYELISEKPPAEQARLYRILREIDAMTK